MAILTFKKNKNFIYAIIYWILEIIFRLVSNLKKDFFKMSSDSVQNEYMFVILLNLADLLSIFLVLYIKHSSKREIEKIIEKKEEKEKEKENEDEKSKSSVIELIYEKSEIRYKRSFYIKIIIIAILDYLSRSSFWISYAITKADSSVLSHTLQKNITIIVDIIMRYIFSTFILKVEVYKHHIFSIIVAAVGFALLIINDFLLMITKKENKNDLSKTFFYTAIVSISGFSYPLEDTFVKKVFSQNYIYPAKIQFYRGFLELILIIVITPILFFSFNLQENFQFNISLAVTLTMIFYTLASFIKAYILLKIVYHYSSQSVSFLIISQSFGGTIIRLIKIVKEKDAGKWKYLLFFLEVLGIVMILISSLINDEIIIINKYGLNENVKSNIIRRSELEMIDMNLIDDPHLYDIDFKDENNDENLENNN